MRYLALLAALFASPALAQTDSDSRTDPAAAVSQEALRTDVETLVGFGTRHTLSSIEDPLRGIGAARRWATARFDELDAACENCLEIVHPERVVTGNRIPAGVLIRNVVAIQRGSERPDEVVIVQAHIDSRASDVMDADIDAPGANDNASGSALVLEAARVLSQRQYPTTIVYALLSGEEQGLFGGHLMADYAIEQGWTVKAVLNNDIVGGSCGSDGYCDDTVLRVFSEGMRGDADEAMQAQIRSWGAENDSPSRNISRWLWHMGEYTWPEGLQVQQVWRADRIGRGGDHLPFLARGLPAVRISVAVEDYDHQHQDIGVEGGIAYGDTVDEMDFAYLAEVTRFNIRALDELARAFMPPRGEIEVIMQSEATLRLYPQQGEACQWIWRRMTHEPTFEYYREYCWDRMDFAREGPFVIVTADELRGDDWTFGLSSTAPDGSESPIRSLVPGGEFYPLPQGD